ncbi:MAG: FAD-dependent monooxygenase, partial [Sphingopyxis sp.]
YRALVSVAAGGGEDQLTRPGTFGPIIVGGGPAGSAAAIALAKGGVKPLLIERSAQTGDALCGGFLSWQSLARLKDLGVDARALGGQRVTEVRVYCGRHVATSALPQSGIGVSRRHLDTLLLDSARRAGTAIERGTKVTRVGGGIVSTADGAALTSPAIFLACGKHGLPDHPRVPPRRTASDPVVGLRLRLPASATLARLVDDAVELFLFDRGYLGLVRHEDGSGNFCLAVHKSRLAEAGGRPEALFAEWGAECSPLGERLGTGSAMGSIDAVAAIPYGWMARDGTSGLWRLGDQAACIPSLAGEGMGVALASGILAAQSHLAGGEAAVWQRRFARQAAGPMRLAKAAWAIAETPRMNGAATALLGLAPGLVRVLARLTRV